MSLKPIKNKLYENWVTNGRDKNQITTTFCALETESHAVYCKPSGADPGFGQGGAPASEAESCRCSEAESCE